jgi:hypothetical protein
LLLENQKIILKIAAKPSLEPDSLTIPDPKCEVVSSQQRQVRSQFANL